MRKPSIFAFGLTLTLAAVGCTSLLGDFNVNATDDAGPQPGTEGGVCNATCNGKCVDTTSDPANCGTCGVVCPGGQTCQTSKCACPTAESFCNGMCAKADRLHCGPSCTPCQNDEICAASCTTAAAPQFKTVVRDPSGWKDPTGAPFAIEVAAVSAPGTIYECRTGPDAAFTPTDPPFAPCDGKTGSGTIHTPTPNATTPEGTYRTEYRYRSDTYRSPTISVRYYIHHALDKVATCPRAGKPTDGPHFTDDQYFAAAQAYSVANSAAFPVAATFPQPSNPPARLDPIYLAAPFIKIPFVGIAVSFGMTGGTGWPAAGADYLFNERSLRHKYVMNPTRTMILERRQYAHPKTGDCSEKIRFGSRRAISFGPTAANRGPHFQECEAFVVNTHGAGLCLGPDASGKNVMVLPVDTKPQTNFGNNGGTVSGTVNGVNTVITTSLPFGLIPAGTFIEVPGPAVSGGTGGGFWYKVVSAASPNITLSEPFKGPAAGNTWRTGGTTLLPTTNVPTGYAKLHSIDGHFYATGQVRPGTPSPKTKCEVAGCNTGKPWLTYLPP